MGLELEQAPTDTKYVTESSSVWYGLFRHITDSLKRNAVLSNPYNTKIIATSLKKTDKVCVSSSNYCAKDILRYVYVPNEVAVSYRHLSRYRNKLVKTRAKHKNSIRGITLQRGNRIQFNSSFSGPLIWELRNIGDYRIDAYLDLIEEYNQKIKQADKMITDIVNETPDMKLLTTIPGVGPYTALTVMGEIVDVSRFKDSHKLCGYAGIVPSIRNSADTAHHDRITKQGASLLRFVLVESVRSHVVHAPNSDLSKFYLRIAKKRGDSKAAVAAASKLLRIMYRMLQEKKGYVQSVA